LKIPYSWLREFIDTRLSPAQVQEALNMAGVEVIMKLSRRMAEMQHRIDTLESELRSYRKEAPGAKKSKQEVKDG